MIIGVEGRKGSRWRLKRSHKIMNNNNDNKLFRSRLFDVLLFSNCIPKHGRKPPPQTYYMVKTNTVKLSLYVQKKKLQQQEISNPENRTNGKNKKE